ncbi:MAG: transposase [Candidatus Anammoxibacter sp.]
MDNGGCCRCFHNLKIKLSPASTIDSFPCSSLGTQCLEAPPLLSLYGLHKTRTRYKPFEKQQPYFTVMTTVDWLPIFTSRSVFEILIKSLKFLIDKEGLKIYAYVVLENHMHMICASETLCTVIRRFKSFTARNIIDALIASNNIRIIADLLYSRIYQTRKRNHKSIIIST